ncbi:uncharacterized protein L969DRAFT_623312 [Mixia osmundae IAM 14324]|uniref:Uncharacterized protein n=1 Tax=Mixia osmundae (strain CBS 9802 / IAM 14324 / JCM 22182 / KY 12970) TaxID=764103 RepID=G7E437_MIXOS|nr:uncharacterized protein L969DRAFT_623312 [Mixia osmundae IAM 14324]KEI39691.1 hypothetical protein L969DRAFT_623312 [Mixia osmundae IAM 14324]GAA97597.1 hypothetical protein E5Q_04275 [Mixia osmundae IAM 14324]
MHFIKLASMLFTLLTTAVLSSPVGPQVGGVVTGGITVNPQYYMVLISRRNDYKPSFTFQLAYNSVQSYYGALLVCNNDISTDTCGAGYIAHGGVGDARWSDWFFTGSYYEVTVRLAHKADGTMTGWTLKSGTANSHYLVYAPLVRHIYKMGFATFVSMLAALITTVVLSSPVGPQVGVVTGGINVFPQYYMSLAENRDFYRSHFTFQLAYNSAQAFYGALLVCNNDEKTFTCGGGPVAHGGAGDDRWSDWFFTGTFYEVTVRLTHKADGTIIGWTLKGGDEASRFIAYASLENLQTHATIPYI